MEISVISIRNSKGIILSDMIIERYQIKDSLELILENDYIILKPKKLPRVGWEKFFEKMSKNEDDTLLIPDVFEGEIKEEYISHK